jgi:predicted glycosyltransferase
MTLAQYPQPILFRAQPMRPGDMSARLDQAEVLAREGAVMLAWGGLPLTVTLPPGMTLAPLPGAQESVEVPGLMLDADGHVADHSWKKRRAAALLALFACMRPSLIVLDGAPSLFRFELRPLLEMARRRDPAPAVRIWPEGAVIGPELAGLVG